MKKNTSDNQSLWIDKTLSEQTQFEKENHNYQNQYLKTIKTQEKSTARTKNFHFQIPFNERFKDKLFAFNKIGKMYKLDESQSSSIKASLIFTKSKLNKNSGFCSAFKNKRLLINFKKSNQSSRVSYESKNTQRQAKSLDVSKITTIFSRQNKCRYAPDFSQIKEQDIQETIIKRSVQIPKKPYTPLEPRRGSSNARRAIHFESEGTIQDIEKSQKVQKPFFKKNTQFLMGLKQKNKNRLPELIGRPNQAHIAKRISININKRQSIKAQNQEEILPKLRIPKLHNMNEQIKDRLLTIR